MDGDLAHRMSVGDAKPSFAQSLAGFVRHLPVDIVLASGAAQPISKLPSLRPTGVATVNNTPPRAWGDGSMAYKIVAQKDEVTVRSERNSLLIAAAKARIWAEEGWDVSVTDGEGKKLERAELDGLFAA
jgi:hypothetical protein